MVPLPKGNYVHFGKICAASRNDAPLGEDDILSVGQHFHIAPEKLREILVQLETSEHPEIALLQNFDNALEIKAVCFVSSAWSHSYRRMSHVWSHSHAKSGTPFVRIYRDYYYQCYFVAMDLLCSVGCEKMQVESLVSGYKWEWDSLVCLLGVQHNLRKLINPRATLLLWSGHYAQETVDEATATFTKVIFERDLPEHRPIAVSPYTSNGVNLCRIFLPQNDRSAPAKPCG